MTETTYGIVDLAAAKRWCEHTVADLPEGAR